MIPKSLSATSASVYELCPKRWQAEMFDKAPQPSGSAASLGTTLHEVAELLVRDYMDDFPWDRNLVKRLYETAYRKEFSDDERYDEGLDLAFKWADRQDWSGRTVLSTETKLNFELKTSAGVIPFNYIFDRKDRLDAQDGSDPETAEIEVIDYKSFIRPVSPGELKRKIQARAYAVAAQIEHPKAKRIWVTFDLFRYEPVGVVFTEEENRETFKYLRNLAERIIADDDPQENLNTECGWCIRKTVCESLIKHTAAGGVIGTDPKEAADRRAKLHSAKGAIEKAISALDEVILGYCEAENIYGYDTDETKVEITSSSRRVPPDGRMVAAIVGDQLVTQNAKLTMAVLDGWLKDKNSPLTDDQKSRVRQLIRKQFGDPSVKTTAVGPFDDV